MADKKTFFTAGWWRQLNTAKKTTVPGHNYKSFIKNFFAITLPIALAILFYYQLFDFSTLTRSDLKIAVKTAVPAKSPANIPAGGNILKPVNIIFGPLPDTAKIDIAKISSELKRPAAMPVSKKKQIPLFFLWFLIFVAIFILWSTYEAAKTKKEYSEQKDPPILTQLYENCSRDILQLHTPRKMKRFSNKVRLQYHQLRYISVLPGAESKSIESEKYTEIFFRILLIIEKDRNVLTLSQEDFKEGLSISLRPFLATLPTTDIAALDITATDTYKKLIAEIYKLNRGILI